jgi:hypothetical protein
MKHFLSGMMAAGWFCMAIAVFAQSISTSSEPVIAAADPSLGGGGQQAECRAVVEDRRGQDRLDQMQLCVAKGRLECLKQTIDQRMVGERRLEFVESCRTGE